MGEDHSDSSSNSDNDNSSFEFPEGMQGHFFHNQQIATNNNNDNNNMINHHNIIGSHGEIARLEKMSSTNSALDSDSERNVRLLAECIEKAIPKESKKSAASSNFDSMRSSNTSGSQQQVDHQMTENVKPKNKSKKWFKKFKN